jgi:predicted metal-dependent hydrolase
MLDWSCGELAEGLRCYCAEDFFEAHEHWESVWLQLRDSEKKFLQGVIQLTVAFHHYTKKNHRGALSLLKRALSRFEALPTSNFGGIDLQALCTDIRKWIHSFETDTEIFPNEFPKIRPTEMTD